MHPKMYFHGTTHPHVHHFWTAEAMFEWRRFLTPWHAKSQELEASSQQLNGDRVGHSVTILAMIIKQLLDAMVCPVPECRKPITLAPDGNSLRCTGCGRINPLTRGIPILLVDQATMPH